MYQKKAFQPPFWAQGVFVIRDNHHGPQRQRRRREGQSQQLTTIQINQGFGGLCLKKSEEQIDEHCFSMATFLDFVRESLFSGTACSTTVLLWWSLCYGNHQCSNCAISRRVSSSQERKCWSLLLFLFGVVCSYHWQWNYSEINSISGVFS